MTKAYKLLDQRLNNYDYKGSNGKVNNFARTGSNISSKMKTQNEVGWAGRGDTGANYMWAQGCSNHRAMVLQDIV